jgi:hypothetical protein
MSEPAYVLYRVKTPTGKYHRALRVHDRFVDTLCGRRTPRIFAWPAATCPPQARCPRCEKAAAGKGGLA